MENGLKSRASFSGWGGGGGVDFLPHRKSGEGGGEGGANFLPHRKSVSLP